jgi:hypothetical protein
MLGNATGFARSHFGATNIIEQRGFAVIDVTHYSYHRCAWHGVVMLLFTTVEQHRFRIIQLGG